MKTQIKYMEKSMKFLNTLCEDYTKTLKETEKSVKTLSNQTTQLQQEHDTTVNLVGELAAWWTN